MNALEPTAGPILRRLSNMPARDALPFKLDGQACHAQRGDTVLTAILTQSNRLRDSEFSHSARAGFCLMGACQDCWVSTDVGRRVRACTTMLEPGMSIVTRVAG